MPQLVDFVAPSDPWELFNAWFRLAEKHEPSYPNSMSLATAGRDGMPSVRSVLLKRHDSEGFTFFTNRESRKGEELKQNPKAGICLYWKSLKRQIHAEGTVTLVSDAESDAYFATRPRGSQIGAWVSQQSRVLATAEALEQRVSEVEAQYEGKLVPRPPYWGGYLLAPQRIEFWLEQEFRLHDRIVYHRRGEAGEWKMERLYP